MFYSAHVALQAAGTITAGSIYKTHSGLIGAFGRDLVLTKMVPDQLGRALSNVHDTRLMSDYCGEPPTAAAAQWAVDQAEMFVSTIAERFGDKDC